MALGVFTLSCLLLLFLGTPYNLVLPGNSRDLVLTSGKISPRYYLFSLVLYRFFSWKVRNLRSFRNVVKINVCVAFFGVP